jgi:hypothetical protein
MKVEFFVGFLHCLEAFRMHPDVYAMPAIGREPDHRRLTGVDRLWAPGTPAGLPGAFDVPDFGTEAHSCLSQC